MITFEEAIAIDKKVYRGEEVSAEDKAKVKEFINFVSEDDNQETVVYIWAAYAVKDYQ